MGTCVSLIFRCDFTHIILLGIKTFIFHGFGVQGQFGWLAHFHKWLITWIWFHHLTTPKIQHRYKPEMILFKYGKFGYLYLFQGGGVKIICTAGLFWRQPPCLLNLLISTISKDFNGHVAGCSCTFAWEYFPDASWLSRYHGKFSQGTPFAYVNTRH